MPFRLQFGCPAGPLVRPGETQPRKSCNAAPENSSGHRAGGTHRHFTPAGGCGGACARAGRPRPCPAGAHGRTARPRASLRGAPELPAAPAAPIGTPGSPSLSPYPYPSPSPSLSPGPAPPRPVPGRCARRRSGHPPQPSRLPRGGCGAGLALPFCPPLAAGRAGGLGLAWLGLAGLGVRLQRGARRESPGPRRGEPSAQAHGGGGGGGRRAAGAAAPAPRPPTRTCCRAAVSWSAASSTAAADDLLARPQPLRTPGVPARAGDDRSASRSPVQRSPRTATSAAAARRSRRPRGAAR